MIATSAAPAALGGEITVTDESLSTVTDVPGVPPNITDEASVRFDPLMVTFERPTLGPISGEISVIVGALTNLYAADTVTDSPPGVVRTTSIAPAGLAGVTTVIELALRFVIDVAVVPPKVTADVSVSVVPVIVTIVPPATGPEDGTSDEIVGASTNVYADTKVADPPGVVNTTSTAPADLVGVTTDTDVGLITVNEAASLPPKDIADVSTKLVPVIVSVDLPATGPDDRDTLVIVGASTNVYASAAVTEPPSRVVSTRSTVPANFSEVTTVTEVSLTLVIDVAGVPPKVIADVSVRFLPVIVNVARPDAGPDKLEIAEIIGRSTNWKAPATVTDPPAGVVSITLTTADARAGVRTVTEVGLTTVSAVPGVPPNVTSDDAVSVVPVMVTKVPPVTGPADGATFEIVGVLTYV